MDGWFVGLLNSAQTLADVMGSDADAQEENDDHGAKTAGGTNPFLTWLKF